MTKIRIRTECTLIDVYTKTHNRWLTKADRFFPLSYFMLVYLILIFDTPMFQLPLNVGHYALSDLFFEKY